MKGSNHIITATTYFVPISVGISALVPIIKPFSFQSAYYLSTIQTNGLLGTACLLCLYLFGTLLVDIDSEHSIVGKRIHLPVCHRGITHSVYPLIIFLFLSVLFYLLSRFWSEYSLFFAKGFFYLMLGYFFHLLMDEFSEMSIKWFNMECHNGKFRHSKRKLKLTLYTSRIPWSETVFLLGVVLFGAYLNYVMLVPFIKKVLSVGFFF